MGLRSIAWVALAACAGTSSGMHDDAATGGDGTHSDAAIDGANVDHSLTGNRDRLLATYLAFLQSDPQKLQSNGLRGADLHSVCELWTKLAPSSQQVFTTITHRLYGSLLADGSHALEHVQKLYRLVGGQGADAGNAGSCGGGEYNRMIMQQDTALHDAQVAANTRKGATPYDIADAIASGYWRDSHDGAGPHTPFDLSDEANDGAPRGQTQYFKDPASAKANAALGRLDLETLVDPFALEMDQDYDCVHNSNPACSYVFYGPACAPATNLPGFDIYTGKYGDPGASWKPTGC
jgi:hypothetical protein